MKNTRNFYQSAVATAETIADIINVYYYKDEVKVYYSGARINMIKFIINKENKTVDMYLTITDDTSGGYNALSFPLFGKTTDKKVKDLAIFVTFNNIDFNLYKTRNEIIEVFYLV